MVTVMVAGGERGSRASAGTCSLRLWPFHSYPSPAVSVTVVLATMSAPLMGAGGGGRERGREGYVSFTIQSQNILFVGKEDKILFMS